jgi:L-histidine N-alpha-methyltransferase
VTSESVTGTLTVDVLLGEDDLLTAMRDDVVHGLTAPQKRISPMWFYDEEGSRLFEEITRLEEYYPTRAERALLVAHSREIAARASADTLVELGAGALDKSRLLLDAMASQGELRRYVPFDVSETFLVAAAGALSEEYESLDVAAVVGDFHRHLAQVPVDGTRLIAFLGGTIGNLAPAERSGFFVEVREMMGAGDSFLLGTDLLKDRARILAAYNDSDGVTAAFNRNSLRVLNQRLGADFVPECFEHVALWNEAESWIEMRLRSARDQVVQVTDLDLEVVFAESEDLLTEISAKFTPAGVAAELAAAGLEVCQTFGLDEGGDFLLTLAIPATIG